MNSSLPIRSCRIKTRNAVLFVALDIISIACLVHQSSAQNANAPTATPVPEIVVTAPKAKHVERPRRKTTATAAAPAQPVTQAPGTETGNVITGNGPPLQQTPALDKTGTKLEDLPQSVVVVPRSVIVQQAGASLADAIKDVSGINQGGSSSYGFFDRFTIRGMDARIYSDGFPDGDQFNGFPHSINGVQSIEVLERAGLAPYSAADPPGGTINIVHFLAVAGPRLWVKSQLDPPAPGSVRSMQRVRPVSTD